MLRMRMLVKEVKKLNDPVQNPFFIDWRKKEHEKSLFITTLAMKGFYSDIYYSFYNWLFIKFLNKNILITPWSMAKHREHLDRIEEIFDACIKRGYIEYTRNDHWPDGKGGVITRQLQTHFRITQDGKEYTQWLHFIENSYNESKNTVTFVITLIGGGFIGMLSSNWFNIWNQWTNTLSKLFFKN